MTNTHRSYRATMLVNTDTAPADDVAATITSHIDGDVDVSAYRVNPHLVSAAVRFDAPSDATAVHEVDMAMRHLPWPTDSLRVTTGRGSNWRVVR